MLVKPENRTVTGHLPGQHIAMQFDPNSVAHLMDLLGKGIYNDPEMAVLREYACNARDSHIEAANPDPIEVVLPTTLAPFLKIIDHGVGLNWDDFINIWSKFGASTKRIEGNMQTGSLGIGSKSGLAYGDQFNVIAIKDGVKCTISVSKTIEGGGDLTLVAEEETDEPNGVEIQIPAKRWNEFQAKAAKLFQYWPRGSVTVNGIEPEPITERAGVENVGNGLYLVQEDYTTNSTVVMCNVPYPVPTTEFCIDLPHNRQILAYVEVDAVDFAGNREQVRLSKKTQDTLKDIGKRFAEEMQKAMQAEIDACSSCAEAMRIATKWYLATPERMRPKAWTYKGQEIPQFFAIGEPDISGRRPTMTVVKKSSYKQTAHDKMTTIPFHTAINAQWFYGYDLKFTSGHRRRIDAWASQKRLADPNWTYPDIYILANPKVVSDFLDPDRVTDWEEVRKIKMPNSERAENGRLLGSYDVLTGTQGNEHEMLAEDIDDAEPIYYFIGEANKNLRWTPSRRQLALPYHNLLVMLEPGCTTILIPDTRRAKLLRTFPNAQSVQSAVAGLYQEWLSGLDEDQRLTLYIRYYHTDAYNKLTRLDAKQIEDPDLKAMVTLLRNTPTDKLMAELERYHRVGRDAGAAAPLRGDFDFDNPLVRYPLYNNYAYMSVTDHVYIYMNAVYSLAQTKAAEEIEALVANEVEAVAA